MTSTLRIRGWLVGLILLCSTAVASPAAAGQDAVTWTRDVAPIVFEHCAGCHRAGGIGPFSLLDYETARDHASAIAAATASRRMPPWKPEPGDYVFDGERRLSDAEIAVIGRWAAAGAEEGTAGDLPTAPIFADDWQLGPPDLIVTLPEGYALAAGEDDLYRNFALPVALDELRWIKAVELRPGLEGVIHHARILLDETRRSRALDAEDLAAGYDGLMLETAHFSPGHFIGWAPGKMPTVTPDSLSWALVPGTDLVLQVHLLPGADPVVVRPEIGLYFAKTPATLAPVAVLLNSKTIDIPAGDAAHVVQDRYRLPVDVDLLAIYPHAHYLGKEMHVTAELPDGTERTLLRIDDWDFNWQDEYRYAEPVHVLAGTTVTMHYVYDNSAANPHNPNDPPVRVGFGPRATDEMAELILQVLTIQPGAQQTLLAHLALKRSRDEILGHQAQLRKDPDDHATRTALAVRYLEVGQIDLAVAELEEAIRLAPDSAEAYYNLGTARLSQNQIENAIAAFRQAIEIRPDYAEAHNNLGGLLDSTGNPAEAALSYRLALQFEPTHAGAHYNLANALMYQGSVDEAIMHYRDALAATPNDADVHNNLGRALTTKRTWVEAVAEYRRALALNPDLTPSLVDLAWLLATAPDDSVRDAREALVLIQRAGGQVGLEHPTVLDTLAAAYASNGQFEQAVATARTAAARARETPGFEPLAPQIEQRLQLYLSYRPYRLP